MKNIDRIPGLLAAPGLWAAPRLLALAAACGVALAPGVAVAEGPGYGGTADQLSVQWQAADPASTELSVSGVGFRAGSQVVLRAGDATEEAVTADEVGAVRAVITDATSTTPQTAGASIIAVGQTPGGSTLTLVGFVPASSRSGGFRSLSTWVLPGLGIVALCGGGLARVFARVRGARHGSKR
jgi:hypothetical protein